MFNVLNSKKTYISNVKRVGISWMKEYNWIYKHSFCFYFILQTNLRLQWFKSRIVPRIPVTNELLF